MGAVFRPSSHARCRLPAWLITVTGHKLLSSLVLSRLTGRHMNRIQTKRRPNKLGNETLLLFLNTVACGADRRPPTADRHRLLPAGRIHPTDGGRLPVAGCHGLRCFNVPSLSSTTWGGNTDLCLFIQVSCKTLSQSKSIAMVTVISCGAREHPTDCFPPTRLAGADLPVVLDSRRCFSLEQTGLFKFI